MKTVSIFLTLLAVPLMPQNAQAHIGHIGELAGHGHFLGIGAVAAAAALVATVAIARRRDRDVEDETADEPDTERETV